MGVCSRSHNIGAMNFINVQSFSTEIETLNRNVHIQVVIRSRSVYLIPNILDAYLMYRHFGI